MIRGLHAHEKAHRHKSVAMSWGGGRAFIPSRETLICICHCFLAPFSFHPFSFKIPTLPSLLPSLRNSSVCLLSYPHPRLSLPGALTPYICTADSYSIMTMIEHRSSSAGYGLIYDVFLSWEARIRTRTLIQGTYKYLYWRNLIGFIYFKIFLYYYRKK